MAPDDMGHIDEATVARFLDAELPEDERERVFAHLEECDECRAELRDLHALAESAPATGKRPRRFSGIDRWTLVLGALAASVAAVSLIRMTANQPPPEIATRAPVAPEGTGRIEVIAPSSPDVRASDVRFSWHASNVDAYRFTLLDESGQVLFTSRPTADTTMSWPRDVPQSLGVMYFWSVDGIADGVSSSTGARRLRIVP